MTSGGTNYYYHADGLGSTTEITDSTGNTVENYRYDAYGTPTIYDGSAIRISQSAIGNRLLFTGRDCDPATGWYNYRYRYYNPTLGRFAKPDPIGLDGRDANLYRYVLNSPLRWVDPVGLWTFQIGVSASGGAATGGNGEVGVIFGYSKKYGFQVGFFGTLGGGMYAGAGGSVGLQVGWSKNPCIKDVRGWSNEVGRSGGAWWTGGGNVNIQDKGCLFDWRGHNR